MDIGFADESDGDEVEDPLLDAVEVEDPLLEAVKGEDPVLEGAPVSSLPLT